MRYRVEYIGSVGPRKQVTSLTDAGIQFDPDLDVTYIDATTDEVQVVVVPKAFDNAKPPATVTFSAHKAAVLAGRPHEEVLALEPISKMEVPVEQWGRVSAKLLGLPEESYDLLIATGWAD